MATTYAEKNGKQPFDWNAFLNQEHYTPNQLFRATKLASSWVTCACGNQCDVIPRDWHGSPEDDILCSLGCEFLAAIFCMKTRDIEEGRDRAKRTLHSIEERSAIVINNQQLISNLK